MFPANMERLGKRRADDDWDYGPAKKVSGVFSMQCSLCMTCLCVSRDPLAPPSGRLPVQLEVGACRLMMMGAVMGIKAAWPVLGRRYVRSIHSLASIHPPTNPPTHKPTNPPTHPPITF